MPKSRRRRRHGGEHTGEAGLTALTAAAVEPALADHHRFHAVRAHLLEQAGAIAEAGEEYRLAARTTLSLPERRYLEGRAARLEDRIRTNA